MALLRYLLFILISVGFASYAQSYTLSGSITAADTQETLLGVTVYAQSTTSGTVTNNYGVYSLTLPKGNYRIVFKNLGFKTNILEVSLDRDQVLNVSLEPQSEELDEVVVTEDVERIRLRAPEMSVNRLSSNSIKQTPVVLGESDILKVIQLLPGVTSAGEGASGFNVRGGGADQNLILLDEATVFNSSHLFGFFSVFNTDAIKDVQLYKGGIPASYGGRTASVLRIDQKEGTKDRVRFNGGVGVVSSRGLLEGPLGKGSFLVAGRGTYAHLFLNAFDISNIAYFYDLNTKITLPINDKNRLLLSGYFGRDVVAFDNTFENTYGNTVVNVRWNTLFSNRVFGNLSLIYSDYYYGLALDFVGFDWDSGIQNLNLKYDLSYNVSEKLSLETGIQTTYYNFNPGFIRPLTESSGFNDKQLQQKFAAETAIYVGAEHELSPALALRYGLRLNQFNRLAQSGLERYANDQPITYNSTLGIYQEATPIGTYSNAESTASFTNIEPRFTLAYRTKKSAWKASYQRIHQYLHLISNTSSPTPLDVWTTSGKYLKPQRGDQWAVGYATERDNGNSFEVESFYKITQNRYDYIDGAELVANKALERILLAGKGRAYGLEVLFKKTQGQLTGLVAYTLSKAEQQTKGFGQNDPGINNGDWYNAPYDKTHDLSMSVTYTPSKQWQWNANFVAQTGQPVTYPIGQYEFMGTRVPNYGKRNAQRLPFYHRLDIAATLTPKKNSVRKLQGSWVFGIYNIYNRRNAATISFKQDRETGNNQAYRLSIFGIVPSVTYNIQF
ncbi:MAG: TonB-dependent receptor [Bacteroidetes bacterium]|nr:TonB-dependent receptor [Bacteroidota bacterium]MDA1084622.1 TonB-dependent receptor [Bacteroidota bacterium]